MAVLSTPAHTATDVRGLHFKGQFVLKWAVGNILDKLTFAVNFKKWQKKI